MRMCLKVNSTSPSSWLEATRRTKSLCSSASSTASTSSSSPTTRNISFQNVLPITDASRRPRRTWGGSESIRAAIASRIDSLPPQVRRGLLDASVIGKTFWKEMLRVVGELDDVDAVLEALEQRDFVRRVASSQLEGDVEFTFKHILIRDVAYGTLPRAERRDRHGAVARYVEE